MANIIIIGAGVMSSAFTLPCNENNHDTFIIGSKYDDKIIDEVNENNNFHTSLKVNLSKKTKFIKYENLSKEIFKSIDLIVIGTNSKGLEWSAEVLEKICSKKNMPPILLLTKGIHIYNKKFEVFIEKLTRILNNKKFKNIIRNFSINITELRDNYLNKYNIDINDWIVNNYDNDIIDNIEKDIIEIIDN